MSLFAKRAAPVQATYLGYQGSTGLPNMDWVQGDEVVAHTRAMESAFVEMVNA
jgi:predicted O-linked N-acetylglucosamine transferase (SPINDLY family)